MADEIKNGQEDFSADISNTIPEKPKRTRSAKKAEDTAKQGENTSANDIETAKPARKPRKKPETKAEEAAPSPTEKPKAAKPRKPKAQ